jgi:hypothetical protein
MTVLVFKAGVLSALGHDHRIAASICGGTIRVKDEIRIEFDIQLAR